MKINFPKFQDKIKKLSTFKTCVCLFRVTKLCLHSSSNLHWHIEFWHNCVTVGGTVGVAVGDIVGGTVDVAVGVAVVGETFWCYCCR